MSYGVEVKMITGDHLLIAVETAKLLDLGDRVLGSNDAQVLPNIKTADGNKCLSYDPFAGELYISQSTMYFFFD